MFKKMIPSLAIPLLALFLSTHPLAQQPINQSRPASPDGLVTVSNVAGQVTVTGWEKNEVSVTGTLGKGTERLEFEGSGSKTSIRVVLPEHARNVQSTDLQIHVPAGSRLNVECVSADIDVSGVSGDLDLETVSGSLRADGAARELRAQTVSGEIELAAGSSQIRAESVSGSIDVKGKAPEDIRMETVSGGIRYAGALSRSGSFEASTVSGDVVVELPKDTAASFKLSTFSGGVHNEFPVGNGSDETRMTGGHHMSFATDGGGARVVIETFSGSVRLTTK